MLTPNQSINEQHCKECDEDVVARSLCGKHYQRWVKYGDPKICMKEHGKAKRYLVTGTKETRNYVHRSVMEAHIGRPLARHEHIHHLNHNIHDNRIENLQIIDPASHKRLHLIPKSTLQCVSCSQLTVASRLCGMHYQRIRIARERFNIIDGV